MEFPQQLIGGLLGGKGPMGGMLPFMQGNSMFQPQQSFQQSPMQVGSVPYNPLNAWPGQMPWGGGYNPMGFNPFTGSMSNPMNPFQSQQPPPWWNEAPPWWNPQQQQQPAPQAAPQAQQAAPPAAAPPPATPNWSPTQWSQHQEGTPITRADATLQQKPAAPWSPTSGMTGGATGGIAGQASNLWTQAQATPAPSSTSPYQSTIWNHYNRGV